MQYAGTLIAVKDMELSKQFYSELLGLQITGDFGANVMLQGGVFLQTADTWISFISKKQDDIQFANYASELYFEEEDLDVFIKKLETFPAVVLIHPIIEHSWGQRAIRFCDPDGHIVEVAENIKFVVRRFLSQGLSKEETAVRMDVPIDYILSCI